MASHAQPFRPIDPRELRPGRAWYVVAVTIVVLGVVAGVTIFVLGLTSIAGDLPTMKQRFAVDEPTTVELSADADWAVYVDSPGDSAPAVECAATSPDGDAELSSGGGSFQFSSGSRNWHLLYEVSVPADGAYEFTCTADGEVGELAVGDGVDVGGFVGGLFGSIGALIGLPCFAFVVGGSIILIVALRRSAHKRRLAQPPLT